MAKTSSIEEAIEKYQAARKDGDTFLLEEYYREIIRFYDPLTFRNFWWKKYGWAYDFDYDEFNGDYKAKFIDCLNKISTDKRNGKSVSLNNYFYRSCEMLFGGLIKKINTAKRNPIQKCPMCETDVANMSTHIRECHKEIVWEKIGELQMGAKDFLDGCPFCPNHLPVKKCQSDDKNVIIDHVCKYHSTILFDKFREMYPEVNLSNNHVKYACDYQIQQDDEYFDIMDLIASSGKTNHNEVDNSISLNHFVNQSKTELENKIIEFIFDSKITSIADGKMTNKKFNNWMIKMHLKKGGTIENIPPMVLKKDFDEAILKIKNQMVASGLV